MADFDDFSTAHSHRHPRKKRLLGLGLLGHLNVDHPPSFNQHSAISKSPPSSRESSESFSLERSTLPSSYSLVEPKDFPLQAVLGDFVADVDSAPPDLGHRSTQARDFNLGPDLLPTPPLPSLRTMAPHGRPKLKRGPREHDLQNATMPLHTHQLLTSPGSPSNENRSTFTSHMSRPRSKLKRAPHESTVQDATRPRPTPSKSPLQCLSSPASPTNDNSNQLGLSSSSNSRDKSPVNNHIANPSSLAYPEVARDKSPVDNHIANPSSLAYPEEARDKSPVDNHIADPSSLAYPEVAREKSPSNDDRASPDPDCAICLGKLRNKSFTDSCLHQFCFKCLVQWSKVKPECPLCKQGFKSIIHNVRSNEDYDQYHCRPAPQPTRCRESLINELLEFNPGLTRFRYRTTMTDHRMTVSGIFREMFHHSYVIPPAQRWPPRTSRRQLATAEFRTNVYNRDSWVEDLPDFTGRFRECSPEFYSANQAQLHRLVPWLNREIPCVVPNSHVPPTVIIDMILSLITRYSIMSSTICSQLRPYFGVRTRHFLHEFYAFARSPFDLIGFDQAATYGPNPTPTIYTADINDSDDTTGSDSDVICLEADEPPVAGPSGLNRIRSGCVSVITSNSTATASNNEANSSSSQPTETVIDDSDDCEIVDYIKPRHERTPEIVVLSDTDEEVATYQPSSSGIQNRMPEEYDAFDQALSDLIFSPNAPSTRPSSDSDYVPYSQKPSKDKVAKKRCSRKKSTSSRSKRKEFRREATKSPFSSETSDSDEDLSSWARKHNILLKERCSTVSSKKRSRQLSSESKSPPRSSNLRIDEPGPSGFLPRQFCSDDSLKGHSSLVIPYIESGCDDLFSPHLSCSRPRELSARSSDLDRLPVSSTSRRMRVSSPTSSGTKQYSRDRSSSTHDMDIQPPSRLKSSTWCIKPSSSDHAEITDDNATTPASSPENPPRLKSIVIMRNPNDRDKNRLAPMSYDQPTLRIRSQSPVASTSRSLLQSQIESLYSRKHYRSPSCEEHSSQTSALSSSQGKTSKHKYKSKSSKKDCKRKASKRSDPSSSMVLKNMKSKLPSWYRPKDSDSSSSC